MAILNRISDKTLLDFPIIYNQKISFLKEHPRFSIMFSPGFMGIYKRQICRQMLDPLIPATQRILIYDLQTQRKQIQKYKSYLTKKQGRHILNMAGKRWGFFMPLLYKPNILSTIHAIRGSILLQCVSKDIPWESIFKHSCGPFVFDNASVCSGKAALSFAKRNFDGHNVFIIIDKINSGLECITISCHREMIADIFNIAAKCCRFTTLLENDYVLMEKAEKSKASEQQ